MANSDLNPAIRRSLALITHHPAISAAGIPSSDKTTGAVIVDVTFAVNLPNRWRVAGHSPSGVRGSEIVQFQFPSDFPLLPPAMLLRPDFGRRLPHLQPWTMDGRPVPCIYDGELAELLHSEGMAGILNQTAVWLDRAANDALIDPMQGWEPVRRDALDDYLVADADSLRKLVNRDGGHKFFGLEYLKLAGNRRRMVHGQMTSTMRYVNRREVSKIFEERPVGKDPYVGYGRSLALVVWPGKYSSGALRVCDVYLPETVENVDALHQRAELYGCGAELKAGLNWLERCLAKCQSEGPSPLAVVLLTRRPVNLIGSSSPIELCPYITEISAPFLFADSGATTVRPAGHRQAVSRALLSQMAGVTDVSGPPAWTLIGAGSLGSKLATHLARAGRAPTTIVDRSCMTPHNAARNALIPPAGDMQILWSQAKAQLLSAALRALDQDARGIAKDIVSLLKTKKTARTAWAKHPWAVVNATASLTVREALAATDLVPARIIEMSLFARGRAGVVTIEGPQRNPNTADLMAECYAVLREDRWLAQTVFSTADAFSRQIVGDGCGSLTTPMSDGRLSLFAASMSEYLLAKQKMSLPDEFGEVLIGQVSDDGIGLQWKTHQIAPVKVVPTLNGSGWRIHLHQRAVAKIREETARWPTVETGGVLLGRLSEVSRTIHVVDVLGAPEDSSRTPGEFVLGTKGLRRLLQAYSESVNGSLYCLGTWHNHLTDTGPSLQDRATANAVSLARVVPSVLLVCAPQGFHALLADRVGVT